MIDWTLNIPTIFAIVGALGWLFRMEARTRENTKGLDKLEKDMGDDKLALTHLRAEISIVKDAMHAHRLHAAETFATKNGMTDALARMEKGIEGLTQRFDAFALNRPAPRSRSSS